MRFSDVIEITLVAPCAFTALAMRGGLLRWTWGLFTASLVVWLVYDGLGTLSHYVAIDPSSVRVPMEGLRALACAFLGSAGFAQPFAVRG